jgi:hypothetical protein
LNGAIEQGTPWVRILGEPVWAGRSDSEIRLWTQYESLLNLVFWSSPATVLCPYNEDSVDAKIVRQTLRAHPQIVGRETIGTNPDYQDPAEFVLGNAEQEGE